MQENPVVLITGGAQRIGAEICKTFHAANYNILIHYRHSANEASRLAATLNQIRPNSAHGLPADLLNPEQVKKLLGAGLQAWGRLDVLVNNASSFYPTDIGKSTEEDWQDLIGSNMKAPFFLSQAASDKLKECHGCIINITDIHAQSPLKNHTIYCSAKAGLVMLTKSLAKELAPEVRVNAVAPGAILWPENDMSDEIKTKITSEIALKRPGHPSDIAKTVLFLARDATYITGQVIAVDGGRSI